MSQEVRLENIVNYLGAHPVTTVYEIGVALDISMPTVYKDLRILTRRNMVTCDKGSIRLRSPQTAVTPLQYRMISFAKEKKRIAKAASQLIDDHMVIFLDASTTASFLVPTLKRHTGLTVLSNGLMTAIMLSESGIHTICVGGNIMENSLAACRQIACDTIARFSIDVFFFSASALTPRGLIVDASEHETALRKYVLQKAKTSAFLCDHSKLGETSVFCVAALRDIDYLVTDETHIQEYMTAKEQTIIA